MTTPCPIQLQTVSARLTSLGPGLLLCVAVSGAAWALEALELRHLGKAWLETLVLAILVGAAIRTMWTPAPLWRPGVEFGAKTVLEAAVMLLGAAIDARTVAQVGPGLLIGVIGLVALSILGSYGLGRIFRLPRRMALLIACGNSICGNSAIAAVAPVIGADSDEVAAAIAFTAVLGVGVVVGFPVLAEALHMSPHNSGVFAGLTVYAVPQVLAATAPIGPVAVQVGTVIKLVRVMLLGPVLAILSLIRLAAPGGVRLSPTDLATDRCEGPVLRLAQIAPWFIVGFVLLMTVRSLGFVPVAFTDYAGAGASVLTIVSMAALGLGVDVRALVRAGPRVSAVVTLSLVALGAMSLLLLRYIATP